MLQEDVGWLDVAVDHAAGVGVLEGLRRCPRDPRRLPGLEGSVLGQDVAQAPPADQLHHEVGVGPLIAVAEDAHDPWVAELPDRLGLAQEALARGSL